MGTLYVTHPTFLEHASPSWHPERPDRLGAVRRGAVASSTVVQELEATSVEPAALEAVHPAEYVRAIEAFCSTGGGHLDADTYAVEASWNAALHAAGAGPQAVDLLDDGAADTAFLAVRPPGHHALAKRAMGFCLFNNVAVTAEYLIRRGQRVAVIDWDVHHGNGTQDLYADRVDLLYVSVHEYPFYPGTGWLDETGYGPGVGTVVNIPVPAGTTGDVYRAAFDRVIDPVVAQYEPDWVLVSAGFDAHRRDPLADIGLEADDYGFMARRIKQMVPAGRVVYFLEGGYDLEAIEASVAATLRGAAGHDDDGGPGGRSSAEGWRALDLVEAEQRRFWKIG